jgi:hypothetical protein
MFCADFLVNGPGGLQGHGQVGEALAISGYDPGYMRPYFDKRRRRCVTINVGGRPRTTPIAELLNSGISNPVWNATTLRKDEWIQLDQVVIKAARARLRAWSDLAGANTYGGFNAMGKPILEYMTMSDSGEALVDMDGLSEGRTDAPLHKLQGIPLPITHSDFWFSSRFLQASRQSGTPIDTSMAEMAGRRVAEMVEKTTIGTETGPTYGDSTRYGATAAVYGYTNFPSRNTKTDLTTPLGTNPEAIVQDILEMRDQLYSDNFFGPFILYHSTGYESFLDNDYFRAGGTSVVRSLRERILAIDNIQAVRRLDYFTPTSPSAYALILVQMTADVARAINGMDITTIQWESQGGMRVNFKVMAIQVPQLRADYNGNCGILHATTA